MAVKTLAVVAACAALVGVSVVSPAAAAPKPKPDAGLYVVVDRYTGPITISDVGVAGVSHVYAKTVGITGTLHGCAPGTLWYYGASSTLGPTPDSGSTLGWSDGAACLADGTLRISGVSFEDPQLGNTLSPGMKGTATVSAWGKCIGAPDDNCGVSASASATVRIPRG